MSNRTSTIHHHATSRYSGHHADHDLLQEAENLLSRLEKSSGGDHAALADKVRHALEAGKKGAASMREYVKNGVHTTEATIKERPWTSVGVAAAAGVGIGLLIGLLSRRND